MLLHLEGDHIDPYFGRYAFLFHFVHELFHLNNVARLVKGVVERPPVVVAQRYRARHHCLTFNNERLLGWPLELSHLPHLHYLDDALDLAVP